MWPFSQMALLQNFQGKKEKAKESCVFVKVRASCSDLEKTTMENFYCRIILWLSCMLLSFVLLTLSQYFPVWPSTQSLSTCIYY